MKESAGVSVLILEIGAGKKNHFVLLKSFSMLHVNFFFFFFLGINPFHLFPLTLL